MASTKRHRPAYVAAAKGLEPATSVVTGVTRTFLVIAAEMREGGRRGSTAEGRVYEEVADARRCRGCARDTRRCFGVDDHAGHARTGQREGARVRAGGWALRRRGRARRPGFRALLDEPATGPRF